LTPKRTRFSKSGRSSGGSVERGWTKVTDPMAGVKAIRKRSKGKRQLVGLDESRRFLATGP